MVVVGGSTFRGPGSDFFVIYWGGGSEINNPWSSGGHRFLCR